MKGDFARVTFDPALHYSRVFQQQGRVLLEADWNEQGAIQLHLLRVLATDLVGPCWAAGKSSFVIDATDPADANKTTALEEWRLSAGRFYVDGMLCVNEAMCTLAAQPYRPTPDYGITDDKSGFENAKGPYALWLDVWERHLSSVEAPDIEDLALNGVDTCSRAQVVWQLRMLTRDEADRSLQITLDALQRRHDALDETSDEAEQLAELIKRFKQDGSKSLDQIFATLGGPVDEDRTAELACEALRRILSLRATYARPRLRAQLQPPESDEDPCVIAADARYRGCENQLYRIEIHEGGLAAIADTAGSADASAATFKWSRENGSVIFSIVEYGTPGEPAPDGSAPLTITLAGLGRDARLGLTVGNRVELLDDDCTLAQRAFPLLQVIAIDVPGRSITLNVPKNVTPYLPHMDPDKHPLLRRWDQHDQVGNRGVSNVVEGTWIDLEDGIQIRFETGGIYATGDYWLIPARVADNGTLEWPQEPAADGKPAAAAVQARGLHHYAVLGGVDAASIYRECCCRFIPPCQQRLIGIGKAAGRFDFPPPLRTAAAPNRSVGPARRTKPKRRTLKRKPA